MLLLRRPDTTALPPPERDDVSGAVLAHRGGVLRVLGAPGTGKTTLMKVLDGTIAPDSGTIVRETGVSVARLEQEVPDDVAGSTFDVVAAGPGAFTTDDWAPVFDAVLTLVDLLTSGPCDGFITP